MQLCIPRKLKRGGMEHNQINLCILLELHCLRCSDQRNRLEKYQEICTSEVYKYCYCLLSPHCRVSWLVLQSTDLTRRKLYSSPCKHYYDYQPPMQHYHVFETCTMSTFYAENNYFLNWIPITFGLSSCGVFYGWTEISANYGNNYCVRLSYTPL